MPPDCETINPLFVNEVKAYTESNRPLGGIVSPSHYTIMKKN